ncbi:hypothetical protein [Endozoicomonas sp. YOMI1]|uniref:hypothetical protein n=1 Tax=Endozoicomonas sp. YOMI1 TaxID=2828739 RepID=UPI002148CDA4|nr:hypothetical protein [Endozoicomonas sp. YOMI1]
MIQSSVVSPQVSSFILNTKIPDSDIPIGFFGLRSVNIPYCKPDQSDIAVLPDSVLVSIASKMSFSDFVNFSATHTRNVSILRSDYLVKRIFDRDESMQELLLLRDLLKRIKNLYLERSEYFPNSFCTKCSNIIFDEGPGQLKFKLSNEFNDSNARNLSNTKTYNNFSLFVLSLYDFACDQSVHSSWRAFCCNLIVKINNNYGIEDDTLAFERADEFLTFAKGVDQADYDDNRIKLTKLFDFMMTKPSTTELDKFIEKNLS